MKHNRLTRTITALITAALLTAALPMTAAAEDAPAETSTTNIVVPIGGDVPQQTTRALEEGDKYAINKLIFKEENGVIPGGYTRTEFIEETQQALYTNGKSRVIILAQNYKEDMQELDQFADSTSAMMRIRNITSACDTIFSDPVESEVDGFRALVYDCDILQYEFLDETTKRHIDTFKGRNYYFYSDDDVYALMFDTNDEDWEEQSKCFEQFIDAIEVEGSQNNSSGSFSNPGITAVIAVAGAVIIAGVISAVVIGKKKKKSE